VVQPWEACGMFREEGMSNSWMPHAGPTADVGPFSEDSPGEAKAGKMR
jgi:hypothetical protein